MKVDTENSPKHGNARTLQIELKKQEIVTAPKELPNLWERQKYNLVALIGAQKYNPKGILPLPPEVLFFFSTEFFTPYDSEFQVLEFHRLSFFLNQRT